MTTTNCERCREQLPAYVDRELDVSRASELEAHLAGCAACTAALERQRALSEAVRAKAPYYRAPAQLQARLRQSLALPPVPTLAVTAAAPRSSPPRSASWWLPLAAGLLVAIGTYWMLSLYQAGQRLTEDVVAAHVRSLMVAHLEDVPSTDQHTVKPWFADKLDFSPIVHDLAPAGFPLAGGRLDYLAQRKVAALVYRHRLHVINLFIWPETDLSDLAVTRASHSGFNVVHWRSGGMAFWAVSDLNGDELSGFADKFRSVASQP